MSAPPPNVPISGEWLSGGFDSLPVSAPVAPKPVEPPQPKPLAIVLPFIEREREQVLPLLEFSRQLNSGKPLRRTLYLVPFKGLKIDDVLAKARAAFVDVQVIADSEGAASDWKKDDKVRDAAGPNSLFRQAAWFFYLHRELGPWLWLEPDCVPLVRGWDETIEAAYRFGGKPFLGARMKFQEGEYLNGAAVYPRDAVARAPALVTRATWTQFPEMEIAFDVAGGAEVLRQASFTDLIHLEYRTGAEAREGAVLLHGDRDGELLAKLLSGVPVLAERPKRKIMAAHVPTRDTANGTEARDSTPRKGRSRGAAQKSITPNGHGHFETVGDQMRAGDKSENGYEKCGLTVNRRPTETLRDYKRRLQAYRNKWSAKNPGKVARSQRSSHLRKKFGLTIEQYEELFQAQDGQCAVCKRPAKTKTSLHVDHSHHDGRVRGLLCNNCNIALGLLKESETTIQALRDYVRFTKPTIGDQIRFHVGQLVKLATNANRRTRILAELRKTNLLPRIAR